MMVAKTESWVIELNRSEVLDLRALLYIAVKQCDNLSESEIEMAIKLEDELSGRT